MLAMETDAETRATRAPLSAFVIAYNRRAIIGTCLRALAFADELIVIDKGSTDGTVAIAEALADRVISVPWTPTVEATREFAAAQCTHEWVLFLDDDECLSAEAVRFLDAELAAPRADVYRLPLRHYIMGLHDERSYYWPENHVRCFRRGRVAFTDTVHGGMQVLSDRVLAVAPESGACIHHLSHRDVWQWIEKANRYTSQPDRKRSVQAGSGIARFAHERIDHWLALTDPCEPDAYPVAAAVLRAVYDLIDRLKTWEEEAGLDGAELFRAACARLDATYATDLADLARPRTSATALDAVSPFRPEPPSPAAETAVLARAVQALRDSVQAQREAMDSARAELEAARLRETEQRDRAAEMQRWAESGARLANEFETKLGEFSRHHEATIAVHEAAAAARMTEWEAERNAWNAERAACGADRAAWVVEHTNQVMERVAWEADRSAWAAERTAGQAQHAVQKAELRALAEARAQAIARAEAAEHRNRALTASTSWRITMPMRAMVARLRRRQGSTQA
jgi:hypothetical protein